VEQLSAVQNGSENSAGTLPVCHLADIIAQGRLPQYRQSMADNTAAAELGL
jgi:hypothetical protein